MTLPYQRTNAVIDTRKFLSDLLDPKVTPRVPRWLRIDARWLLKHYPHEHEMKRPAEAFGPIASARPGVKRPSGRRGRT